MSQEKGQRERYQKYKKKMGWVWTLQKIIKSSMQNKERGVPGSLITTAKFNYIVRQFFGEQAKNDRKGNPSSG